MAARETVVPLFVPHLGCPNDCVFCNQRRISGQLTPATPETVYRALEAAAPMLEGRTNRQLAFYGGSFTAIPAAQQESLLSAARDLILRGRLDSIRLSTRPDAIDPEVIKRLKAYGVETVELGAQSMDEAVLLQTGRGHTASAVSEAAGLLKANGFRLIIQMMTGLPGDSDETCVETAKKIIALKPHGVRIYPTVIIRDTALYDLWKAGLYPEHTVEDAVRVCAKLLPLFNAADIPVIRLGLNPTDELSAGGAVAGAYHPALGELVKSRVLLNELLEEIGEIPPGSGLTLCCPEPMVSQLVGQHRCNIDELKRRLMLSSLKIVHSKDIEKISFSVEAEDR